MYAPDLTLFWFELAAGFWLFAVLFSLLRLNYRLGRSVLTAGGIACLIGAVTGIVQGGSAIGTLLSLGGFMVQFRLDPAALWLIGWAALPTTCAVALGSIEHSQTGNAHPNRWIFGAALGLLGALGVFGLQNGAALLIAWEAMSLGAALMLLADRNDKHGGQAGLFMLALLEVGAVALLLALAVLGAHDPGFTAMSSRFYTLSVWQAILIGLLLIIGTGAKLGLLPFYEWFPGAYGHASGSSGAIFSGLFLNAAWFVLARALLNWAPSGTVAMAMGVILLTLGVFTAILAILFALQENDWRRLLGYSTAENAGLAVVALGAALVFRAQALHALSALAFMVGLIHLAGHSLAKGALLFSADAVFDVSGSYAIKSRGLLKRAPWTLGIGAVFAGMSLAAMPPTIGFVSEWYLFQTIFHSFALHGQGARLALALAGAGVALTAALALATFVKLIGIGLLGRGGKNTPRPALRYRLAVLLNGLAVPGLAVALVWLLPWLGQNPWPLAISRSAEAMTHALLLVPLSAGFAFISPVMLVVVGPLLAVPVLFAVWLAINRRGVRRAPLWSGGLRVDPRNATTALAFSNAMRVFYGFVYRPTNSTQREYAVRNYFIQKLQFEHAESSIFTSLLFRPATRLVVRAARLIHGLQSGFLNDYIAIVGIILLAIFAAVFFY